MELEKSRVAELSVAAAAALATMKLVVGLATDSLGILSEALHSLLDLTAALITWASVKISDKPADKEHNFGHGKIENFSALIEAVLLLATCVWIVWEAVSRLSSGKTEIEVGFWSFAVVIASIIVDMGRSRALMHAAHKFKSQVLEADAIHFSTDILSSSVVLFGLICASLGFYSADSIAALGVALIVVWVSLRLSKRAVDALLDKAPEGLREQISSIIRSTDGVIKSHDLRVRSSGADNEIDVNIHVDPELTVREAHNISEKIERAIRAKFGKSTISVHIEPEAEHRDR